jgi:hypothetical protein
MVGPQGWRIGVKLHEHPSVAEAYRKACDVVDGIATSRGMAPSGAITLAGASLNLPGGKYPFVVLIATGEEVARVVEFALQRSAAMEANEAADKVSISHNMENAPRQETPP